MSSSFKFNIQYLTLLMKARANILTNAKILIYQHFHWGARQFKFRKFEFLKKNFKEQNSKSNFYLNI